MPISLEIISPERLLLSRPVDMVVIPGTEGDFGILPGHAKLITGLRGGLVDLYEKNQIIDRFFVSGGFAEVTEERCSVLADDITRQSDLDPQRAAAALEAAKTAYAEVDIGNREDYIAVSDRLISAQAMVDSVIAK